MNATETLALNHAINAAAAKAARAEVGPGTYDIDVLVHVTGTVKVGQDTDRTPTVSIPLLSTLALVLHRSGFQRAAAIEIIRSAVTDALLLGKDATEEILKVSGVNEALDLISNDLIPSLPRSHVKGRVTTQLVVEQVTSENARAIAAK